MIAAIDREGSTVLLAGVAVALAASYLVVAGLGTAGLPLMTALWLLALPWLCRPFAASPVEWMGAGFVLSTAGYTESLDEVLGTTQLVSATVLLLGAAYVALRRDALAATLRAPITFWLGAFLLQQCASALLVAHEGFIGTTMNRASVLLSFVVASALARRPRGAQLLAWAMLLGALVSVAMLLRELVDPDLVRFPQLEPGDAGRAGGLYQQPNNAGAALDFALAATVALRLEGAISGLLATLLAAALSVGLLCTASRGAFAIAIALAAAAGLALLAARRGRRVAIAAALVGALVIVLFRGPAALLVASGLRSIDDTEVTNLGRLEELVLTAGGVSDELADHDGQRGELVNLALRRIADRPLLGLGTGSFMSDAQRSHVELLEIVGENGVVGLCVYAMVLLTAARAVARRRGRARLGRALVGGAWLLTHLDHHNIVELRFLILPLAYATAE